MIDKKIMNRAIKEAIKSDVIRGKIGACLFTNSGHVVTSAHNSTFLGSNRFRTIHAEEALLNKAHKISAKHRFGNDLNVLVIRWQPGTKKLAHAKPCPDCQRVLRRSQFRVFYSNIHGEINELSYL